jgi:DNA-binding NtrC family response regulator
MRRIAILEDDSDNLSALSSVFEHRWEAITICFSDPTEAVWTCCPEASEVDLLVCDVDLRAALTGIDAALQVVGVCPCLPILIVSGTGLDRLDDVDFAKLPQLMGERVAFIEKPFTADRLLAIADNLVESGDAPAQFIRDFYIAKEWRKTSRIMPRANRLATVFETAQGVRGRQ